MVGIWSYLFDIQNNNTITLLYIAYTWFSGYTESTENSHSYYIVCILLDQYHDITGYLLKKVMSTIICKHILEFGYRILLGQQKSILLVYWIPLWLPGYTEKQKRYSTIYCNILWLPGYTEQHKSILLYIVRIIPLIGPWYTE